MLYTAYEMNRLATAPARRASGLAVKAIDALPRGVTRRRAVRRVRALHEVVSRASPTHRRPSFAIDSVVVDGREVAVREEAVLTTPFATLLHFRREGVTGQPKVLLVGPLSGHFATLIAPTVRTMLAEHDVHVLDWHNAREVPVSAGRFGLDEYTEHVVDALRHLGGDSHVVAICQPCVPVLAAVSLLAASDDPAQPRSMTLMAGPIDTRVAPNRINEAAGENPLSWYEKRLITTVPRWYPGAGRRVYPGFVQLAAFMSMNAGRHVKAHVGLYRALVKGDAERADRTKAFYDEYNAVMDVPAEFYLETVSRVFQQHLLPRGDLEVRGQRVVPGSIRRTALLTVEGEKDDICSPGQTAAAHDLCTGIPADRRDHLLQEGVGHYGVFSGSRWESSIYPRIRRTIERAEAGLPLREPEAASA